MKDLDIQQSIAKTLRIDPERVIFSGGVYYVPNVKLEDFRQLRSHLPIGVAVCMGAVDGSGDLY